jgi:methyltransferase
MLGTTAASFGSQFVRCHKVYRMSSVYLLLFLITPLLLVELARSKQNERWLRSHGAVEPRGDPHALMAVAYPGMFVVMALEGWWRGGPQRPWLLIGLLLFALAKLLKYYAIISLGPRWCFRVLPLPGAPLVSTGPYRFFRHPNYIALAGEVLGAAALLYAPLTGLLTGAFFATLVMRRIAIEERALGLKL